MLSQNWRSEAQSMRLKSSEFENTHLQKKGSEKREGLESREYFSKGDMANLHTLMVTSWYLCACDQSQTTIHTQILMYKR